MKKEEVPQDLPYYESHSHRDLLYVIDENGRYVSVVSDGWSVKNDAIKAVWDEIQEECDEIRQQFIEKKISPLAYHIKKSLQDVVILSAYSGIPKRKIRKHLKYEEFMKLDEKTLQKYADAMRITVEELKQVKEWK